jgi:hypothetical protein
MCVNPNKNIALEVFRQFLCSPINICMWILAFDENCSNNKFLQFHLFLAQYHLSSTLKLSKKKNKVCRDFTHIGMIFNLKLLRYFATSNHTHSNFTSKLDSIIMLLLNVVWKIQIKSPLFWWNNIWRVSSPPSRDSTQNIPKIKMMWGVCGEESELLTNFIIFSSILNCLMDK